MRARSRVLLFRHIELALAAGLARCSSSCCHVDAGNMFDEISMKMKQQLHAELLEEEDGAGTVQLVVELI
ncbi:unnamed protein product [Urochloa humidicola]